MRAAATALVAATVLAACSTGAAAPDGLDVADGWTIELVRDDLDGPTQLVASDDRVLVAELAGGEDAGEGRVRDLGPDGTSGAATVVVDGLLTPTGVAVVDEDRLVVQEQRRLVRFRDSGPEVVTEGQPFNGRSQGSLSTVRTTDGAGVVATVTGRGSGPEVGSSGLLQVVRTADGRTTVTTIATGFKNGYAHAVDPATGDLYVTEVADGTYDGEVPPDELHRIPAEIWEGALYSDGSPYDGGWPRCTGDADPTEEFGATAAECAARPRPLALFPPRATPTGVAVTGDGRVLVALWVEGRVVAVDPDTGDVADVVTGLDHPQHLLARTDGSVLVTVHGSGELLRLVPD